MKSITETIKWELIAEDDYSPKEVMDNQHNFLYSTIITDIWRKLYRRSILTDDD